MLEMMKESSSGAAVDHGTERPIVLRTVGLTKRFRDVLAVDGLDLEVYGGEVLGLLGPNGSGKSTTVGMIVGLLKPTSGTVDHRGLPLEQIGAIIETPAFYPFLSGRDNLRALALATGDVPRNRVDELIEMVGLTEAAGRKFHTYSLGMKQRLGIASTLLNNPRIVILDEPTNGLDPAGQQEIRALIPRLAEEGRSVILASHLLHEVEQVCHRVAIMQRGKLLATGPVSEFLQRSAYLEIGVDKPEAAAAVLERAEGVRSVHIEDGRLHVDADADAGAMITRVLAENGLFVSSLSQKHSSLEEVFLQLTSEAPTS
jgi:ABC-2 type transport system ATP-binding protein